MQSSPPQSDGKARAIRELSMSMRSQSPRSISTVSPPPSDSNPTKHSGFGTHSITDFFKNDDVLMSTQHKFDETNTLPQYPQIRSTAKKFNSWQPYRSEPPNPDTSMVNKQFGDFDLTMPEEDDISIEQGRGLPRSNRSTPAKMSSRFDELYDMTPPPTTRSRKSLGGDPGSLRRDAQIRRASRNDMDTASPRPASTRKSPAAHSEKKRHTLSQMVAKVSEDESSAFDERPPTLTYEHTKNTRWGSARNRQSSLQVDGTVEARPATAGNATGQSFILPDLPNLTELVSGIFEDGTPVFSKSAPSRSRFSVPKKSAGHRPVDSAPIPDEEKAIFAALQLLQDKVSHLEHDRAETDRKIEEQELELIELRAAAQTQRRNDSGLGSTDGEGSGKGSWKVEKTRLDATVQTLRTKLDRAERKIAVFDIEKKRLNQERDNMAGQLGVAFQNFEEVKAEKEALRSENESLRQEIDSLRAENESLRDQLEQEQADRRNETIQLRQQLDQTENVTQRENITLQAELMRVRAQHDEHTQQLARKEAELRRARKEQAEYARLKSEHEQLQAQLAEFKAKREEEFRRWTNREASLKSKVERRDDTIRHFQDMTQEQTNEAMRLDNENLRHELAQLAAQQEEEHRQWAQREAELKRKVSQREGAAKRCLDMTQEALSFRQGNTQVSSSREHERDTEQRRPSFRREESTRSRIRDRVQQEVRNSKASHQSSFIEETPRKSYTGLSRNTQRSIPADASRSFSAPVPRNKQAQVDSDVESTTDLSLAPRGTPYSTRRTVSERPATANATVQPPADLSLTELSFIDTRQVADLRRQLEEERAAFRRASSAPVERAAREDTIRSERQTREDTLRSVASDKSSRRPSLPRKSSLKDSTKTNATQFEEDLTGNISNLDAMEAETTQTKQSAIDASMVSNTGRRRRRSAPTEMTSAFIVPDIKVDSHRQKALRQEIARKLNTTHSHDEENCTVCRRQATDNSTTDPLRVPKLVPVSSRMPDDVDATLRPARSPREALALVVKELRDERFHLNQELAVVQAMLELHDPSMEKRKRNEIMDLIAGLLQKIKVKDDQIYALYDVLEGQEGREVSEQEVEEIEREVREGMGGSGEEREKREPEKKKGKKVTIQSFVDEEEEEGRSEGEEDEDELPWEGFEDEQSRSMNFSGMVRNVVF